MIFVVLCTQTMLGLMPSLLFKILFILAPQQCQYFRFVLGPVSSGRGVMYVSQRVQNWITNRAALDKNQLGSSP